MTETIYAIGDIHGQRALLEEALSRIEADGGKDANIVFLGDYVDRGPDSKGVIDILCEGLAAGRNWTCIKGNHDRLFEWFVTPPAPRNDPHLLVGYHWFHPNLGGIETAASYGLTVPERVRQSELAEEMRALLPDGHLRFLQELKTFHRVGPLYFVHAGVRPGVALEDQVEDDLVWIRQEFLMDQRDHGAFIVHGHTPVDTPDFRPHRLNLDTGAGYGRKLTAAAFEGDKVFILTPSGRVRL
ncbi:MAG: metallophosphoesterase family protein [Sagittula sp.]|jgi:serine/threonine protein phosphatase 1|uniref:metallophosphoesterase family protein n=1 Tax=unclassified Sagittula TaxID=2624628 RepID=UPI0024C42B1D|nr:metallophosphoesterase family protein [Sagittula sp. MA-2]WHZ34902.1 metallophosphoesterase family protein [Sagittula sp. MA-2]